MKDNIFRKSSIDRVNSPEQLDQYIRVASPGIWLVLTGIVLNVVVACSNGNFMRHQCRKHR